MAGRALYINSVFNPRSYEEMARPYIDYAKRYNEMQGALNAANAQASTLDNILHSDRDRDSEATSLYSNYVKDLSNISDSISKYGLNPSSRNLAASMAIRYSRDITPIQNAWQKREEQEKAEKELQMKYGSSILIDRPAATRKIDDYMQDDYPENHIINTDVVTANVAKTFMDRATKAKRYSDYKNMSGPLSGQYAERETQTGFTPEEIETVIQSGGSQGNPELRDMYKEEVTKYVTSGEWDEEQTQRIINAVNTGVRYGIGTVERDKVANRGYDYSMQLRNWIIQKKLSGGLPGEGGTDSEGKPYAPRTYYYPVVDANHKKGWNVAYHAFNLTDYKLPMRILAGELSHISADGKIENIVLGLNKNLQPVKSTFKKKEIDDIINNVQDMGILINHADKYITVRTVTGGIYLVNAAAVFGQNTQNILESFEKDRKAKIFDWRNPNHANGAMTLLTKQMGMGYNPVMGDTSTKEPTYINTGNNQVSSDDDFDSVNSIR